MGDWNDDRDELVRAAVERFETDLIRYARRLLGDADAARDAVQETFLRLCRSNPPAPERLRAWLYAVCRNHALDLLLRRPPGPLSEAEQCPRPGPPEDAERADTAAELLSLLDELPENQREALHLKFAGGLSYREIADVTGRSAPTVGFLIHRGVSTLRDRLRQLDAARPAVPPTIPLRKGDHA